MKMDKVDNVVDFYERHCKQNTPITFLLQGSANMEIFFRSLQALIELSDVTGPQLNPHLNAVLPQVIHK